MPEESAVLEAPEIETDETPIEGTETPVETPESGAEPISGEPTKPAAIDTPPIKDGKFSPQIKATLDKLKAENPAIERQIRNALFKADQLSRALPGGLKELNVMRELVEKRGGETGLQEMSDTLAGFQEFDQLYATGDPKAIDFMTSDPEGQQAFLKLMPVALQKFEQMSPDGYSGYMAGVFASHMASSQIPLALMRLQDFIGDNPKAAEQVQKVIDFYNDLVKISKNKVEPPKGPDKPDTRASDLDQREQKLTRDEWRRETAAEQQQTFQSEWNRLAAGRKLTSTQDAAIRELFESRFGRVVQSKHTEKLDRFFQAKDKAGFIRYANEISRTEIPAALKAAFEAVMPSKPGPKGAPAPAKGPATPNAPPTKGFTMVAKAPAIAEVDMRHSFNTPANWQKGQAILRDGKRVQWKRG